MSVLISNPQALAAAKAAQSQAQTQQTAPAPTTKPKRPPRTGNTRPKPLLMALDQPGRLRVGHMLTLFGISSPTLYARVSRGELPPPDGYMGVHPYWDTQTVRALLHDPG